MATLFFSYAHQDEALRNELEKHLAMLKREGAISTWHDRKIVVGDPLDSEISNWLQKSEVILLLVSSDFLDSDYCYGVEMARAMERHQAGEAKVIPVILRACDWHPAPFGNLLAAPRDGKPVTLWPNQDEAFLDVAKAIRSALATFTTRDGSLRLAHISSGSGASSFNDARSSNLRVRKHFTDRDKDDFLDDSFEYIARYFDSTLKELHSRNPDIDTRLRRDGKSFEATAYRDGKALARCVVKLAGRGRGFGEGITLAYGTRSDLSGAINESLSVVVGEQMLALKPMGLAMRGNDRNETLSQEGGAEYYWSIFIEPLQR